MVPRLAITCLLSCGNSYVLLYDHHESSNLMQHLSPTEMPFYYDANSSFGIIIPTTLYPYILYFSINY